jgi:hypothetical protein
VPTQRKRAGRLRLLMTALVVASISVVGAAGAAQAAPTGILEICKEVSDGDTAGSFGFRIQGRTGVIEVPVGSCSFPIELPVGRATVTEVARPGYTVAAITAPGRLRGANLSTGTATVDIVAGDESNQTLLTFTNKATPKGFLEICKAKASADDKLNGNFNFTVSQPGSPTRTVSVPVGGCAHPALQLFAGRATITEVARTGAQLVGVTTTPPNRLVGANLQNRTAVVEIVAGNEGTQTIVVFTNKTVPPPPPPTGTVKVCKRAGPGVAPGSTFSFTLGTTRTVAVRAGSCSSPQTVPAGPLTVTEKATNGLQVSNIRVAPATALIGTPSLIQGTVTVRVTAGRVTEVEFTNRATPPGTVKVCKVAGHGVVPRTPFSFTVGTTPVTVLAGSCSLPLTRPATELTITEAATAGMRVSDITVAGAGSLISKNLQAGRVTLNVASGLVTEVVFTNTKPHTPVTGCVRPWKHFKQHPDEMVRLVPDGGLTIGGDELTAAQVDAILQRADRGNLWSQLERELITALLNQLAGGSTPIEVQAAIDAAQFYLSQSDGALHNGALNTTHHSGQTEVTFNDETYEAGELRDTLRHYNGGKAHGGPRYCHKPWNGHKPWNDDHKPYGHEKYGKYVKYKKYRHLNRYCWPI